jgi:hypothetical protein
VAWPNCVDVNLYKTWGLVVAIADANFPQPNEVPKAQPLHKFPHLAFVPTSYVPILKYMFQYPPMGFKWFVQLFPQVDSSVHMSPWVWARSQGSSYMNHCARMCHLV